MGIEKRESKVFSLFPIVPRAAANFRFAVFIGVPCGASTEERGPESSNVKTKFVYQSTIRFAKFGRAL